MLRLFWNIPNVEAHLSQVVPERHIKIFYKLCHIILAYPASECFENIPRIRFSWSYQFTKFLHLFMTHSVPNNLWNFLGIVLVFMTSLSTPVARSREHPDALEKGPQFPTLRNRHPGHSVVLLIYTATVSDTLWFYTHLPFNGLLSAWRTPVSITSVLSFCKVLTLSDRASFPHLVQHDLHTSSSY